MRVGGRGMVENMCYEIRRAVVPLVWESNPKLQAGARPNHQPIGGSDPNHQGIWSPPRAGLGDIWSSAPVLFLQEQINDIIIKAVRVGGEESGGHVL